MIKLTQSTGGIVVDTGALQSTVPFAQFTPQVTGGYVKIFNRSVPVAEGKAEQISIDGTALTAENALDMLNALVPSGGSGGGGDGVSEARVRQIVEGYNYVPFFNGSDGKKHIRLENGGSILGDDTRGVAHNLIMLSEYDVCDISSATIPYANVNTPVGKRLTDQEAGETGVEAHEYAYRSESAFTIPSKFGKPVQNSEGKWQIDTNASEITNFGALYAKGLQPIYPTGTKVIQPLAVEGDLVVLKYQAFTIQSDGTVEVFDIFISSTSASLTQTVNYKKYRLQKVDPGAGIYTFDLSTVNKAGTFELTLDDEGTEKVIITISRSRTLLQFKARTNQASLSKTLKFATREVNLTEVGIVGTKDTSLFSVDANTANYMSARILIDDLAFDAVILCNSAQSETIIEVKKHQQTTVL